MIKEVIVGLWTSFLQMVINIMSSIVFRMKKREAIELCRQYGCKYYVIQQGYWKWQVLRAGNVQLYKKMGIIGKNVTAKDLAKISAYIADPVFINIKLK